MTRAFIGFLTATAWLTACGDGGSGDGGADRCTSPLYGAADELHLTLETSELSNSRHFMVVGEGGTATADFVAGGVSTLWPEATFRSSNPSVAQVSGTGNSVTLTAVGTGSASITAEGCGLSDQGSVEVSAAPLPIDELHVSWYEGSPGTATNDASGNLVLLTLATGEVSLLRYQCDARRRGGPGHCTSADRRVERQQCRGDTATYPPGGSVSGRAAGTAEMTVTVRNLSRSFQVQVTAP